MGYVQEAVVVLARVPTVARAVSLISKKEESHIVGSYRDDADGAAITLNSDGTGTYVMENPTQTGNRKRIITSLI